MKGYAVVVYRSSADAETMKAYAKLAVPALTAYGALFPIRSTPSMVTARECGQEERVMVVQFPSKEQAIAAYESAAYQEALALLKGKAERDVRFVDGQEFAS